MFLNISLSRNEIASLITLFLYLTHIIKHEYWMIISIKFHSNILSKIKYDWTSFILIIYHSYTSKTKSLIKTIKGARPRPTLRLEEGDCAPIFVQLIKKPWGFLEQQITQEINFWLFLLVINFFNYSIIFTNVISSS